MVTVADAWSPRADYLFTKVWSTPTQLAKVANAFYDTIVEASKKMLVFRLWAPEPQGSYITDWESVNS